MNEISQSIFIVMLHNNSMIGHEWWASWYRWLSQPPQQGLATRPVGKAMRAMMITIGDMCEIVCFWCMISTICLHDIYTICTSICLYDVYTIYSRCIYTYINVYIVYTWYLYSVYKCDVHDIHTIWRCILVFLICLYNWLQCVGADMHWRAASVNCPYSLRLWFVSALMLCMSFLRILHWYRSSFENRLFLSALLVSAKCMGVYLLEFVFDCWRDRYIYIRTSWITFIPEVSRRYPFRYLRIVFIFGELVNIIKGRDLIF